MTRGCCRILLTRCDRCGKHAAAISDPGRRLGIGRRHSPGARHVRRRSTDGSFACLHPACDPLVPGGSFCARGPGIRWPLLDLGGATLLRRRIDSQADRKPGGRNDLLSTIVFATSWKLGFAYQGVTHTMTCAIASAVMLAGCGLLLWRLRKHPSFEGSLALHTLLFAWIASYAFPYLGETP
jgi:hypothetical protein